MFDAPWAALQRGRWFTAAIRRHTATEPADVLQNCPGPAGGRGIRDKARDLTKNQRENPGHEKAMDLALPRTLSVCPGELVFQRGVYPPHRARSLKPALLHATKAQD